MGNHLPNRPGSRGRTKSKLEKPVKLDRTDFQILDALQKDARISNKELALISGVSQSTCLERVRRLKEQNILTRFHAEVDREAMGIGVEAMVSIRLRQHANIAVRDVKQLRDLVVDTFSARYEISQIESSLVYKFEHCHTLPNYRAESTGAKVK